MHIRSLVLAAAIALSVAGHVSAQTLGSGFTYQGTFADAGVPANGNYDFEFALYSVGSGGSALQTVTQPNVAVSGGLINTLIDFGAATFDGQVKWVEVHVRPAGSVDAYTVLSPRQALTAVPYALGLPMPFQRTVSTGAQPAFQITNADGGTAIEGVLPIESGFSAIRGRAGDGTGVEGDAGRGIGVNGVAIYPGGTGVRGQGGPRDSEGNGGGDGVRGLGEVGVHGVGGNYGGYFQGYVGGLFQGTFNGLTVNAHTDYVGTAVVDIHNFSTGNLIAASHPNPLGAGRETVFRVDGSGEVFANGGFSAGGADVAEYVPANESLEPGDVVEIDAENGAAFRLSSHPNSTAVGGVISTRPGLNLNDSVSEQQAAKGMPRLALSGRVPVKVTSENGAIHAGDLLVSSSRPGHAMRAPESPRAGTVIGKAMQKLDRDSGQIEMLVMLR